MVTFFLGVPLGDPYDSIFITRSMPSRTAVIACHYLIAILTALVYMIDLQGGRGKAQREVDK